MEVCASCSSCGGRAAELLSLRKSRRQNPGREPPGPHVDHGGDFAMNRYGSFLGALIVAAGLISSSASAQTSRTEYRGLGFQRLGARIGFVDPEGTSSTVDLGIHVDAGEFVRHVHVMPLVEYWKVEV